MRPRIVGEANSVHIWLHVGFGLLIAVLLLLNAAAPFAAQVPAIYAAGLTLYMIEASFAFIQHFGFMLSELHKGTDKK